MVFSGSGFGGEKNLRFLTYVHPGGQSLEGDFSTLAAAVEAWELEMSHRKTWLLLVKSVTFCEKSGGFQKHLRDFSDLGWDFGDICEVAKLMGRRLVLPATMNCQNLRDAM